MGQDRFSSMLLSMCLHLGIVALVLLWPLPEPKLKDFKPPLVTGLVTFKGNGKPLPNSKTMQSQANKATEKATVQKQEEPTLPQTPQAPPVQENPQAEEPQKPEVKPLEKVEPKVEPPKVEPKVEPPKEPPAPPEVPLPDVSAIKVPKEDIKKPPQKNATAQKPPQKEVKKPEEKVADKKPDTKKADDKKPDTKKKSSVADALKGLEKDVKKNTKAETTTAKGGGKKPGGKSAVDSALDGLMGDTAGSEENGEGTGPGDAGGVGVGNLGPYEAIIVQSVQPNWSLPPRADRRSLSAVVGMTVEPDGTISQARLVQSSGDRLFDSSLMRAIHLTGILDEPPPNGQRLTVEVEFVPQ